MIKRLLPAMLVVATTGSLFALGPQRVLPQGDQFKSVLTGATAPQKIVTRGEPSSTTLDFTLADEPYSATMLSGVEVGAELYEAFEFSKANASLFKGDQVTSVNITSGAVVINGQGYPSKLTDVTVFITEDLEKEPVYTQAGKIGTGILTEYNIPLDTPYTIEDGKAFYVGYYFNLPDANQAYLVFDGILTNDQAGCWVGIKEDGAVEWMNFAQKIGTLCIGCTISGDNLPQNEVKLIDYGGPFYTAPGEDFEYQFLIQGLGAITENVGVTYSIGESGELTKTVTLDSPIGYNKYAVITLPGLVCNEEALDVPLGFTITKVNGADNKSKVNAVFPTITCFEPSKGYPRVHLMEEGTGTWCGYCPLGIEMMKYLEEKYPDFFARVAIHANGSVRDPMTVSSTGAWVNAYASGFPCALIDRSYSVEALQTANLPRLKAEIDEYVADNKAVPAVASLEDIECSFAENNRVEVYGKTQFVFDVQNDDRFCMSYYLTQDNVGPYDQTNYYSGGTFGAMAGWENEDEEVSTIYEDVCRILMGGARGYAGSLPETIAAGEKYEFKSSISHKSVTSDKFHLIVFMTDNKTGEVVNAYKVELTKPDNSGVSEIAGDAAVIARKYYNLNGLEVKEPVEGIYVVRTVYSDGKVATAKEIVK